MLARTPLTELLLRRLPIPEEGQDITWDSLPGFGIRVSGGGARTFFLKHKNQYITIGRYPLISLAEARTEAKRIKAEFTLGKLRPLAKSYATAVDEFLAERKPHLRPNTYRSYDRHLKRFHFHSKLAELNQHDLARQLKPLAHRPSEHNHSVATWIIFFNWCMKRDYCDKNPAMRLPQFPKQTRTRVLNDQELKAVWTAAGQIEGHFGILTKLLILMGQRVTETASIQRSWINCAVKGDCEQQSEEPRIARQHAISTQCTITFPKEITKNKKEHTIPLGTLSSQLIASLLSSNGTQLFPARGKGDRYFTGRHQMANLRRLSAVKNFTLHDLRRTFATRIAEMGTPPHIVERLLNHISGVISGVSATYNRATYMPEMRIATDRYEEHLKVILELE